MSSKLIRIPVEVYVKYRFFYARVLEHFFPTYSPDQLQFVAVLACCSFEAYKKWCMTLTKHEHNVFVTIYTLNVFRYKAVLRKLDRFRPTFTVRYGENAALFYDPPRLKENSEGDLYLPPRPRAILRGQMV